MFSWWFDHLLYMAPPPFLLQTYEAAVGCDDTHTPLQAHLSHSLSPHTEEQTSVLSSRAAVRPQHAAAMTPTGK